MKPGQALRLALLLLAVGGAGLVVRALAGPWLPPRTTTGSPAGFVDLVTAGCALALAVCWAWLAAGTLLVAARSLRDTGTSTAGTPRWVPRTVRVLVPALLGVAVTTAPAVAGTDPGTADPDASAPRSTLTGLPVPDRVPTRDPADGTAADTAADSAGRTVLVRPGDSLWRITARLLPPGSRAAAVDRGWRRIARANAAGVPDPDLILPGTRLRVPPLPVHPREESS